MVINSGRASTTNVGLTLASAVSLFFLTQGAANAQATNGEAWRTLDKAASKHQRSMLTWRFRSTTYQERLSNDQLEKARAQYIQQNLQQGLSQDEAKKEAAILIGIQADTAPDTRLGQKVALTDGRVVHLQTHTDSLQKGKKPLQVMDRTIDEYSNGAYRATYFDPNQMSSGEIDRVRPGMNPFAYSAAVELDPFALCLSPLKNLFAERDIVQVSKGKMTLRKTISDGPGKSHDDVVTFDQTKGIPVSLEIIALPGKVVVARYSVLEAKMVDTVSVPTKVVFEKFRRDSSLALKVEYDLVSAKFDEKAGDEVLATMGPKGVEVIDYRFGRGKEKSYRTKDHFLSDAEVGEIGLPLAVPPPAKSTTTPSYALPAGVIALLLLIGGFWQFRRNRSRTS